MGRIIVGMGDYAVAKNPVKLATLGLGSCIGIALYDPKKQIGGLAHIMLPSIKNARSKENRAKYADTGILKLVEEMTMMGASKKHIQAKIAGGASMFSFVKNDMLNIGERNVIATKKALLDLDIPIISEDTGRHHGRTIELDTLDGELFIKRVHKVDDNNHSIQSIKKI